MAHRSKHLRENWVPGRVAAAEERRKREEARQEEARAEKAGRKDA
jgi:hypothetical protein